MLTEETDHELIDRLVEGEAARPDRLEAEGLQRAYRRQEPRYPLRAACVVRCASSDPGAAGEMRGHTRNVSRHGLGLLVRGAFAPGEVLEVEIRPEGQPPVFMAGVVRYCRYAGEGYREVGMQLLAAGPERIFCGREGMPPELLKQLREQAGDE